MTHEERTGYRRGDREPEWSDDRPTDRDETSEPQVTCDLCGAPMMGRHCKLVCTRCGYQRDCSDP